MIKEFTGIIVSETTYGESSKIINVLTEENGIIGIMAKGAKKVKSKLRSGTEKFTIGVFNVYYHEGKLSKLISVDIVNSLRVIKSDIVKIGYLTYIVELAYQCAKQNSSDKIYNLLISTINKMEENLDPKILTNILEIKLLDYLGVPIELNKCVICSSKKDIITFSNKNGGLICKNCYTDEFIYENKTILMLRAYYYIDINSIKEIDINKKTSDEINFILEHYYSDYTGLYLKSKKFLEEINSI